MATVNKDFKVKHGLVVAETIVAPASTTTIAPLRIPHGSAPTSPTNGDIWTTTAGMYARINGATVGPLGSGGGAGLSISDTAPSSPVNGQMWWESDTGKTYVWWSASSVWVEIGNAAGSTPLPDQTGNSGKFLTTNGSVASWGTAGGGGTWGSITGTLSSQSDLNTALGLKADLSGPTFTGVPAAPTAAVDTDTTQLATTAFVIGQGYLKSATAASTYQPLDADLTSIAALTGSSGFLKTNGAGTWTVDTSTYLTTGIAASTYVALSGDQSVAGVKTFTGNITNFASSSSYYPQIMVTNTNIDGSAGYINFQKNPSDNLLSVGDYIGTFVFQAPQANSPYTLYNAANFAGQVMSQGATFVEADIQFTTTNNTGTTAEILRLSGTTGATFAKKVSGPTATTAMASFNLPHGTAPTSPVNGDIWSTTSGFFGRVNGATKRMTPKIVEVEINFDPKWSYDANFIITDAECTTSSQVLVWPSGNTATGRVGDDSEWDAIILAARPQSGQFYLSALAQPGPIAGNRKIYYQIIN